MENAKCISGKLLRVTMSVVMAFSLSLGFSITQMGGAPAQAYAEGAAESSATDLNSITINEAGDQFYTGKAIEPFSGSIKTKIAGNTVRITEGKDYTVTYANNTELGTATATLTGMGNYTGTVTKTFNIVEYKLTVASEDGTVLGELTKSQLAELAASSVDNNEAVNYQYGTTVINVPAKQYVTIAALLGSFGKTGATKVTTTASDGFGYTYDASLATGGYFFPGQTADTHAITDGKVQVPTILTLQWTSCDITSTAAVAASTAAGITDKNDTVRSLMGVTEADYLDGNFAGKRFVTNVNNVTTDANKTVLEWAGFKDCGDQFYTGKALTPYSGNPKGINVHRLTEGVDYTVEYTDNVNPGTATAVMTGIGDYVGTVTMEFKIVEYTLTVQDGKGDIAGVLSKDDLAALAKASTDNDEDVSYQYGTTVISVPAKSYVTFDALMGYLNRTADDDATITVAASDGFSYKFSNHDSAGRYFFPAQTTSANSAEGAIEVPEVLALQWASASIESTAADAAATALKTASDPEKAETTVRNLLGATKADYADGNIAGKRFVTNVTNVSASATTTEFTDADYSQYYGAALKFVSAKGLMNGTDAAHAVFGVGKTMTRAEFAVVLWRNACPEEAAAFDSDADVRDNTKNETGMADVEDGQWYTAAANWAAKNGVISGFLNKETGERTFAPNGQITMEQMVAIYGNLSDPEGVEAADTRVLEKFADADAISDWAVKSIAWAASKELIHGYDAEEGLPTIVPGENIARERAATILKNAFDLKIVE